MHYNGFRAGNLEPILDDFPQSKARKTGPAGHDSLMNASLCAHLCWSLNTANIKQTRRLVMPQEALRFLVRVGCLVGRPPLMSQNS